MQIFTRSPSETSGEASNGSFAISENSSVFNHDMAITAENGNKHEILAIVNPVNSLEQAQAEWKMVKNIQTGTISTPGIRTSKLGILFLDFAFHTLLTHA